MIDPACGSGNFLTETFLQLRKLENKIIKMLIEEETIMMDLGNIIKVDIHQFYGIEINDFAVSVATTALWIAESQMLEETESIVNMKMKYLPLKEYNNIVEGNALRLDWNDVIPAQELDYIMGNPPFIGKKFQTPEQKRELMLAFGKDFRGVGAIDYVAGWFKKAIDYIEYYKIEVGFVSTNSVTQGEQVPTLWPNFLKNKVKINYAYTTFSWGNETINSAAVHCVIIGFAKFDKNKKYIFTNNTSKLVKHINPYLSEGPDIIIDNRTKPISASLEMTDGNVPIDGNFLKIEADELEDFQIKEPNSLKYIKKLVGSYELINKIPRYVLWLVNAKPNEIRSMPMVMERIQKVKEFRETSSTPSTQKLSVRPTEFRDTKNPDTALIIPRVSSENRKYIPMDFIDKETIALNVVVMIPYAKKYHFGILTSSVHMSWMRTFGGRLKSDYRYSKNVVYNNFPWPNVTSEQKTKIETTAQGILDARELYPDSSLADLYNELTMPPELRKAHELNDKAVMEAYGFKSNMSEAEIVGELMKLYQKLVEEK